MRRLERNSVTIPMAVLIFLAASAVCAAIVAMVRDEHGDRRARQPDYLAARIRESSPHSVFGSAGSQSNPYDPRP